MSTITDPRVAVAVRNENNGRSWERSATIAGRARRAELLRAGLTPQSESTAVRLLLGRGPAICSVHGRTDDEPCLCIQWLAGVLVRAEGITP